MFKINKKIGEGYYYIVYDLGNSRVIKKQKNKIRFFLYILYINKNSLRGISEYRSALKNIHNIKNIYTKLVELITDLSIIGNPIFLGGINYTQDNIVQLKEVLLHKSEIESINLLENFVLLIKELWKYGCHEKSLNFFTNFGLGSEEKIILMDFNEMTFDKADVIDDINRMTWLNNWSYTQLSLTLQDYYKKRLKEEITIGNLEILWNTNNHKGLNKD